LPSSIQLSDNRSATYLYDAAGMKRKVTHQGGGENKMTEYCSNVIYENKIFNRVLTDEGYLTVVNHRPIYHYYLKDHLGNNRVVLNQDGTTVEQVNHYYPFGGVFDQTAEDVQRYKFGGKELDRTYGLDLYDYSARYMDGALGRFTTMDPLAEKYYGISPYAYCANNPMKYVDLRGDSIDLASIQQLDQAINTNFTQTSVSDLHTITGLTYNVSSSGSLTYATDANGQPIISTTTDANGNTVQVGSATARTFMIDAIDHPDWVYVVHAGSSGVRPGSNEVRLSVSQINKFINGTTNLDNRTLGWGMTLMHELHHTQVGGGLRDTPGNPGPVVTQMNIIRSELNALGGNYGQRLDYHATPAGLNNYIPFDKPSQSLLSTGIVPIPINKFVKF